MDWFVEVMTGEVNWYELVFFVAINNFLLRRFVKGPKGDKGDMGPMGIMGKDGKDGKVSEHLNSLETSFQLLTESDAYKEWKKKHYG